MRPLQICRFPDPILKQPTRRVEVFDSSIDRFVTQMIRLMRSQARCVGLAAPQVGSDLRIAVMDGTAHPKVSQSHGLLVLVNPVLELSEPWEMGREGCLSVPDFTGNVRRAQKVLLKAQDRYGESYTLDLEGFEAVIAQHEVDHLDGYLFLDRVSNLKSDTFHRKQYS